MKFFFNSFLIVGYFFIGFCQAQDCKGITKLKSPVFEAYVGIIDIPADYENTTANKFDTVDLGKYVRGDTSFILGLSVEAIGVSTHSDLASVTFEFDDNSRLVKSDQSIHITPMTRGRAILSTNVRLTLREIFILKNRALTSITVADSQIIVVETVANALRKVAGCLPAFW
ncbi:hypothetical protein [Spirosoma litoris]